MYCCLSQNGDKYPHRSPFHQGLHALESGHMTQYGATSHYQQEGNLKEGGSC